MSVTSPRTEHDELDVLLSDFFKSQLKKPWPNAPVPTASATVPSELAGARSVAAPRNTTPTPAGRSNTARARFTLAASVALALGAGWLFTDGFAPAERSNGVNPATNSGFLQGPGVNAKGEKGGALDTMRENNLVQPPKVQPKNEPPIKDPFEGL